MNYTKLKKVFQTEGSLNEELIEAVLKICKFVEVTKKVNVVLKHPADDKFIECALCSRADYIVGGDTHLLSCVL